MVCMIAVDKVINIILTTANWKERRTQNCPSQKSNKKTPSQADLGKECKITYH